jgi:hypothetical protein
MARQAADDYLSREWQRLFMEQRSLMARAGIHASMLLNGGAAVALLAFIGHLAGAPETGRISVNFALIRWSLGVFGAGVFLATCTYVFTYFINSLRIPDTFIGAHVKVETIDRVRWLAVLVFVGSLVMFLVGLGVAVLAVTAR